MIGVAAVCFSLWLVFDANQLYRSAEAGQLGARRTVAMTVLRPIAALTNALGLSGPVNAANSALGRCGAGAGSVCGNPGGPLVLVPPVGVGALGLGPRPYPHFGYQGHHVVPVAPLPQGPPPLVSPTAASPATVLSMGDSIGEDLGFGLADVFSTDPVVHVVQVGKENTGLARSDYYDWPATLQADLGKYHPQIVVVMIGANDAQSLYNGGSYLSYGTSAWWRAYAARVALIMSEATSAGAHVLWVGLPPMGPGSSVPSGFVPRVNQVFAQQAATHPGALFYSSTKLLSAPKGGFTQYLNVGGSIVQVRYSDGVHLAPAGYDLLARSLLPVMQRAWYVNLHA